MFGSLLAKAHVEVDGTDAALAARAHGYGNVDRPATEALEGTVR
jgi:hypothetical protein